MTKKLQVQPFISFIMFIVFLLSLAFVAEGTFLIALLVFLPSIVLSGINLYLRVQELKTEESYKLHKKELYIILGIRALLAIVLVFVIGFTMTSLLLVLVLGIPLTFFDVLTIYHIPHEEWKFDKVSGSVFLAYTKYVVMAYLFYGLITVVHFGIFGIF
jgi:hypothetical protein